MGVFRCFLQKILSLRSFEFDDFVQQTDNKFLLEFLSLYLDQSSCVKFVGYKDHLHSSLTYMILLSHETNCRTRKSRGEI